jgi:Right handed beta helix region
MRIVPLLMLFGAAGSIQGEDAFGIWSLNPIRSTAAYPEKVIVRIEPHTKGEVFTLDRIDRKGRATTSSTILYLDGKARDFQDSDCLGTQSSRRVDSRTVEILRTCADGRRIRFVRRLGGPPGELVLEITEQQSDGRRQERRLVLKKQRGAVVGRGDPKVDIPAVQAAVDQGGQVVLMGRFSFDAPPTKPNGSTYSRIVTVSKQVVILGQRDVSGEMTAIEGGFVPFFVAAPGARFTMRGLRFVRPTATAVWVYAASGLVIADCRIEGVNASSGWGVELTLPGSYAAGIMVSSTPVPPSAAQPGQPKNFSGRLFISHNNIAVGGTAADKTLGIIAFSLGKSPDQKVGLHITRNKICNITERGINVNQIGGPVRIERNVITTGAVSGPSNGVLPNAIHAVGSGSYLIARNSIVSEWAAGAGIRVQGNAELSESGAVVVDNDVTMSAPEGTVFRANSAAIEIRGAARGNVVVNNRIRGRARAALAVVAQAEKGVPSNNMFLSNDLEGFQASLADVDDHGIDTVIVRKTS